ncbi:MAG TPA: glutathione S-transferase family protein [Beijerinckiaceae bacterium]|nr:glutathione S-transferase family protein [Beijerinckiaceae bacterium]
MPEFYHHPLCPQSRYIRLVMGELGMEAAQIEERVWERRREFLMLNPAGTTPVLVEENVLPIPGADVIAEYLDETRGLVLGERRLLPEDPLSRVEVRRLCDWFNRKFHEEVSHYLVVEKVHKRFLGPEKGGGAPEGAILRVARANVRYHVKYIGHLLGQRNWLAGDRLTYADLAAAAHLSVCDFLGDVPWNEDETAKQWYARLKSRPSFRPLLADRILGMTPAAHYTNLDF